MNTNQRPIDRIAPAGTVNGVMNHRVMQGHVDLQYNVGDRGQGGFTPQDEERAWVLGLEAIREFNTLPPIAGDLHIDDDGDFTNEVGPVELPNNAMPPAGFNFLGPPPLPPTPGAILNPPLQLPAGLPTPRPGQLICPVPTCRSTRCKTIPSLQRHVQREHGPHVTLYFCSDCDYITKKESDLNRHRVSRHTSGADKFKFACPVCFQGFSRRDNCKRHVRGKEGRPDLEPIEL